jgi:hypothetical protein
VPRKKGNKRIENWSNVPKQKNWQKTVKEVSHVCSNKKKEPKIIIVKVPLNLPPEKMSKMFQNRPSSMLEHEKKKKPKKKSHPISPLIFSSDPQFQIFTLSFGDFTDNRKQGTKSGLGRTSWITSLFESMKVCSSFD